MQRTVRLKLIGPTGQLDAPMRAFADACQSIVTQAPIVGTSFAALNRASYHHVRTTYGLMAQVAQTASRHVAGTFATLKSNGHADRTPTFRRPFLKLLAQREWRFKGGSLVLSLPNGQVSFDAVGRSVDAGRLLCGKHGALTLTKRGQNYYACISVELTDAEPTTPTTPVGVDRGVKNLLVARLPGKTPLVVKGGRINDRRRIMRGVRRRLQAKGTRSAKRVLRRLRERESRFVLNEARVTAKHVVEYAQQTPGAVLVFEELTGACSTMKARGPEGRQRITTWAYRRTLECVRLKAEEAGITLAFVDPAYTSRTCPKCGDARKENRRRLDYKCLGCGYRNHADVVGATNISRLWQSGTLALPRGRRQGPARMGVTQGITSKPPASAGGA